MLAVLCGQSSARPHRNTAWCSTTVLQVCHLDGGHEHHEFPGAEAARSRCSSREYVQPLVSRRTDNSQVWCRYPAGTRTRSYIIHPKQVWQVSQCQAACSWSGGHVCRKRPSSCCWYGEKHAAVALVALYIATANDAVRCEHVPDVRGQCCKKESLGWQPWMDRGDQGTVRGCGGARARVYTDSCSTLRDEISASCPTSFRQDSLRTLQCTAMQ